MLLRYNVYLLLYTSHLNIHNFHFPGDSSCHDGPALFSMEHKAEEDWEFGIRHSFCKNLCCPILLDDELKIFVIANKTASQKIDR